VTPPRAVVLRSAGTNCEREAVHALRRAGAEVDLVHLGRFLESPERLRDYRIVLFPGGFSYGDDIASGVVFAVEMRRRVTPELRKMVGDGALVLGICNGFQILVRAGLLPWTREGDGVQEATLAPNLSGHFECRWTRLEVTTDRCAFLSKGQLLDVPVAHAEGRFVVRDPAVRARMAADGQFALRYVGESGAPAAYPANPSGSEDAIAGVCDPTGRVLGLMPHPERNVESWHHPDWTSGRTPEEGDGLRVFVNAVRAAR
jgi:phosphoribosylformylglycinamidine synthase subunit PurQ / glutaminase